jgi:hypothetical protein
MDDRFAFVIENDSNLERRAVSTWSNEHRHRRVVGREGSPVVSVGVDHVVIRDTVLSSARLDVHFDTLQDFTDPVNRC